VWINGVTSRLKMVLKMKKMNTPAGRCIAIGKNVKHAPRIAYSTYFLSLSEIEAGFAPLGVIRLDDKTIPAVDMSGIRPVGSGSASDSHHNIGDSKPNDVKELGCKDIPRNAKNMVALQGAWHSIR
jgi:hypothetical protein